MDYLVPVFLLFVFVRIKLHLDLIFSFSESFCDKKRINS